MTLTFHGLGCLDELGDRAGHTLGVPGQLLLQLVGRLLQDLGERSRAEHARETTKQGQDPTWQPLLTMFCPSTPECGCLRRCHHQNPATLVSGDPEGPLEAIPQEKGSRAPQPHEYVSVTDCHPVSSQLIFSFPLALFSPHLLGHLAAPRSSFKSASFQHSAAAPQGPLFPPQDPLFPPKDLLLPTQSTSMHTPQHARGHTSARAG